MEKEKKLFGKYNDIVLLILGFILTSIAGAYIANHLQTKSWEYQNNSELADRERFRAENVFSEISGLLDERLWKTRRLFWARKDHILDADLIKKREEDYDVTLTKWNINLNKNERLMSRYFGEEARAYFDTVLIGKYSELLPLINKLNRNSTDESFNEIDYKITNLNISCKAPNFSDR